MFDFLSAEWWNGLGVIVSSILTILIVMIERKFNKVFKETSNLLFLFNHQDLINKFDKKSNSISDSLKAKALVIQKQKYIDFQDNYELKEILGKLENNFFILLSDKEQNLVKLVNEIPTKPNDSYCLKLIELSNSIKIERRYHNDFLNRKKQTRTY